MKGLGLSGFRVSGIQGCRGLWFRVVWGFSVGLNHGDVPGLLLGTLELKILAALQP